MAKKAKSRTVAVRLISMALTGYYKTYVRPRVARPLALVKYDPIATCIVPREAEKEIGKMKSYEEGLEGFHGIKTAFRVNTKSHLNGSRHVTATVLYDKARIEGGKSQKPRRL